MLKIFYNFSLIVDYVFQQHDDDMNRKLRVECSKTGGGVAPVVPDQLDGDEVEPNMLDPTNTTWNAVVKANESFVLYMKLLKARLWLPAHPDFKRRLYIEEYSWHSSKPSTFSDSYSSCS